MPSRNNLIVRFKRIVGAENVLTDPEDIYVYSFEHFFRKRSYPELDVIVKIVSIAQAKDIIELAQNEDFQVFWRSSENPNPRQPNQTPRVLIDDTTAPQLQEISQFKEKELHKLECEEEIRRGEQGSFRNFALALKSLFSGLPSQKCLTCKVCSGYCTVASSFNDVETWSSKGRTLLTRALYAGELQPSPKLTDILYSCSLCGLCFAQCFENTQVRKAIMDARHRLVEEKQSPELFTATAKNIFEVGDPSGMPSSKRVAWTQQLRHKEILPKKADVLYWAGCIVSTRTPNAATALGNLLAQAQVDFSFLGQKEGCCGYVLLAAGLWDEAKENAVRLVERVKETRAETLVTSCAGCYYTFTKLYPEILKVELPCQVLHATQCLESLIREGKIIPHSLDWRVTYHDPCSLGRHCNVYDAPRSVLKAVPELDLVEMKLSRSRARCCGAGGGLWSFNNSVAMNSAHERLVKDVASMGVSTLVTTCPTCHLNFRYASVKKSMGIRVYDLSEILELATSKLS
jgi:fumarate reductase (CoM/CoB) subunit B